jgi:hypothetical protein
MRGVKQALLSDPASSCPSDVLSLPFRRLQAFFKVMRDAGVSAAAADSSYDLRIKRRS